MNRLLMPDEEGQHGPWEFELAEKCECGLSVFDYWGDAGQAHRDSTKHADGLIARWSEADWQSFIEDIENGLAWATSESMGSGNDAEIMLVVRRIVAQVRALRRWPVRRR